MTDPTPRRHALEDLRWIHAGVPAAIVLLAAVLIAMIVGPGALFAQMGMTLVLAGLILAAFAPAVLAPLAAHRWTGAAIASIVVAMLVLNLVSLTLPRVGPFAGLGWNWQGKTLDLVWCLALIMLLTPDQRREIGWTWRVNPGTLPAALVNIAIIAIVGFFLLGPGADGGLTLERVLFVTTHPNLVEEIVFRGFMLALLDRAFPPRWTFSGARIGWGVVLTAWLFGLIHGIHLGPDGAVVFDPVWLAMTFVAGLLFGWLRALTGSLWPVFLAHCAPEAGILFALWLR